MAEMIEILDEIKDCLDKKESFVLDAGAGSGKTYTLMQTLDYLNTKNLLKYQQILCITFTNAGKDEIEKRITKIDVHAPILVSTIHEFIWSYIKNFQPALNKILKILIDQEIEKLTREKNDALRKISNPRWNTNIQKQNEIVDKMNIKLGKYDGVDVSSLVVDYDLFKALYKGKVSHDEIIAIAIKMLDSSVFTKLFLNNFPYILIDEYQDTNVDLLNALIKAINVSDKSVIGLFGDTMQRIYEKNDICLDKFELHNIKKLDNFRTAKIIVNANNVLRGDGLIQNCDNQRPPVEFNELTFIYNKSQDIMLKNFNLNKEFCQYKRLYLTNKHIAEEIGFLGIADIFNQKFGQYANEQLFKLKDPMINFIITQIIFLVNNVNAESFKQIISMLNFKMILDLRELKESIISRFDQIEEPISNIIDFCYEKNLINRKRFDELMDMDEDGFYIRLLEVPLKEFIALGEQIKGNTALDTLHGVKGQEFDNVIVNLFQKQKWSSYDFNKLIKRQDLKSDSVLNAHKLLYVACTRARNSLVINYIADPENILDFQELNTNVKDIFGENISIIEYE